jgi:hypothetical protein
MHLADGATPCSTVLCTLDPSQFGSGMRLKHDIVVDSVVSKEVDLVGEIE